jgi:hypothetical protein
MNPNGLFLMSQGATAADYAVPGFSGAVLQIHWCDIEPTQGAFDFATVATALALIPATFRLTVSLAAGLHAPAWVAQLPGIRNATVFTTPGYHEANASVTLADPSDDQCINAFFDALAALADYLIEQGVTDRIDAVKAAGPFVGLDVALQIPWCVPPVTAPLSGQNLTNAQAWAAGGYRPGQALAAFPGVLSQTDDLFPGATLQVPRWVPNLCFPWVDDTGAVTDKGTADLELSFYTQSAPTYGAQLQIIDETTNAAPFDRVITDASRTAWRPARPISRYTLRCCALCRMA